MKFSEQIKKIQEYNWQLANMFNIQIISKNDSFPNTNDDDLNLKLISIDLPQFTSQPIETYLGDQWFIHSGRDEVYRFTMTFRDTEDMALYNIFAKQRNEQKKKYFNEVKFEVIINTLTTDSSDGKKLWKFENCLIDSISQLQFSHNTESQIIEFSVEIKSTIATNE